MRDGYKKAFPLAGKGFYGLDGGIFHFLFFFNLTGSN
jgi:hypothetical protein